MYSISTIDNYIRYTPVLIDKKEMDCFVYIETNPTNKDRNDIQCLPVGQTDLETPGRVVTLVPASSEDTVYGVAFEIHKHDVDKVRDHLNYREKGGYTLDTVTFYPDNKTEEAFQLELYIGTHDNPNYLGPAPIEDIAHQIYRSVGPSGKNVEYLLNLAHALRTQLPGVEDPHVFELEQHVLSLQQTNNSHHV